MTKLTNAEKDKLDNTCGNLRVTKLGTHVKSLEDFVNEMQLDTQADTVAEAINELYHMFVNKDCSSIQIPPPGFFTLWGNDEDGKLYCYYNDKDHPPQFKHIETPGDDEGTLYLYIADPYGDNHYRLEVGQYIAVKHLEDYYTKTEINNLFTGHKHSKSDISDFPSKVSAFTNDKGYLTSHQSLDEYAKTVYVDQQIANINDDIIVDFESKADVNHAHGNINKDGVITNQKSKNVVTDSNGKITTEDKLIVDTAIANSTNPVQNKAVKNALDSINGSSIKLNNSSNLSVSDAVSDKVDKVTGKGLSTNDFTDALKAKLDAIEAQANKYTHPTSHATGMIVEASALANVGSAANANQHDINTKINTALGTKVDKVTGKGLSTNDFTDTLKSKLDSVYEGARAKKRILGYLITSDIDTTNQPLIRIQKDTRLKVRLYDSENGNIINDLSGINFPINLSVNYCINNVNRSLTTTDEGATFNVGLAAGEYPVHFSFAGSGNFYPVYRSIILQVV